MAVKRERGADIMFGCQNKDNDYSSGVGAEYKPNNNLNLYINVYSFDVASNTHFGQYRKNRNIEIGLKQSFTQRSHFLSHNVYYVKFFGKD